MYYTTTSHVPLAVSDSELGMGDRARMEAVGIVALASMRGGDSRDNQLMYASRLISHQVQGYDINDIVMLLSEPFYM